jgi:hypothetical protein
VKINPANIVSALSCLDIDNLNSEAEEKSTIFPESENSKISNIKLKI